MTMYNLAFGSSHNAAALVPTFLGADTEVGRFRDAWFERDTTDESVILAVYTRNGGGNRECWDGEEPDCDCTGCLMTKHIPQHPLYVRDEDDSFDATYATIYYRIPLAGLDDRLNEDLPLPDTMSWNGTAAILLEKATDPVDTGARWQDLFDKMGQAR
jgi:hypothetical protein